ncbi:MAG: hypothetical protein V7707_17630 [Motiliproteus sp.]
MLAKIEQWIDETLDAYSDSKVSCKVLLPHLNGFYPADFLEESFFVLVDEIPKPDFPELRQMGLGDFIDGDHVGITYKNTYFIKKEFASNYRLHFHELVHVLQWRCLGGSGFIERYIQELNENGYNNAPLEKMAYGLDAYFSAQKPAFDIPKYVQQEI